MERSIIPPAHGEYTLTLSRPGCLFLRRDGIPARRSPILAVTRPEVEHLLLVSSQLGINALNADIGPKVVQPFFEHINRWSTDNLLREPVPFTNRSLTEEEFSTVESASVYE